MFVCKTEAEVEGDAKHKDDDSVIYKMKMVHAIVVVDLTPTPLLEERGLDSAEGKDFRFG